LRRQPRPVRRHHDAPVSVHADQRQRPQQHEAAYELVEEKKKNLTNK
jgi:hypothetical protein